MPEAVSGPSAGAPYALIVDDNAINLDLVAFILEIDGFEVAAARDAQEFDEVLARRRPDIVLMDVQLPGMDGLTLTRRLKADPLTARIPVIAVTAYAMKGDEARMRDAGCDGYLSKPIDTANFAQQVRQLLRP